MAKPRILLWDLETGLNQMLGWDLGGKYGSRIQHTNITSERYIISAAWKWVGERRIHGVHVADFAGFKKDPRDDSLVVATLIDLMNEADAVVAHYGDNFDMKYFIGRCIINDYDPPKPPIQIDTYKIARARAKFNSNKLDYISAVTGGPRKAKSNWDWWVGAFYGKEADVKRIAKYNKQDITVLEHVYNRLIPYIPAKINHRLYADRPVCPSCGSKQIQFRGKRTTKESVRHWIHCQAAGCGAWNHVSESVRKKAYGDFDVHQ